MEALVSGVGNGLANELAQPLADTTDGFIAAIREAGGVKTILSEIKPIAQDAAIAIAIVGESVYAAAKLARAAAGSFEAVYEDLKLLQYLAPPKAADLAIRSEAHTSELQPLMRHSSAVFCLK